MNAWATNPAWQNFSSLFREANTALEAKTGMDKSHHLTASLYFGIAALEAFLNQKMRAHLTATKSESEIFKVLRNARIISKIRDWPTELLGKPLSLDNGSIDLLIEFNNVRCDLTHPKTTGHDIYARLETINPISVIATVAEYMIRFHEMEKTRFPYWLFGWNYLNPRIDSCEIILINDQQFSFSLQALGFEVPAAAYSAAEIWRDKHLGTYNGYLTVRDGLGASSRCEPKSAEFPYKPTLCRQWWISEHHQSCGNIIINAAQS